MRKKYFAEIIGTFALVFAGTGAIVVNNATGGTVSNVGIGLTFGLVVMAMIYAIGDISGAHMNPAVTFGFWISGRLPTVDLPPYVLSQFSGAFAASGVMRLLFPRDLTLGATIPSVSAPRAFLMEFLLTFFLMFVIINVSTGAKEKGLMAGVAVGSIIALEAIFAGPVTGASMNPARSLAPALISGNFTFLWIYLLAPVAGSFAGILGCRCIQEKGCCSRQAT